MTKRNNRTGKRSSTVESGNLQGAQPKLQKKGQFATDLDEESAVKGAPEGAVGGKNPAIQKPEITLPSQVRAAPERQIFGATGDRSLRKRIGTGRLHPFSRNPVRCVRVLQ